MIISGFTVRNADAQGIVVTNAFDVIISNNHATGNDRALDLANLQCPPLSLYFEGGEGFDCGEAIHLSGVHHTIAGNGPDGDPGTTVPTGISISSEVVPVGGIVK